MRKITKEEAVKFTVTRGTSGVVRSALVNMKPGEVLLVEKKDWRQKNSPGQMLTRIRKSTGMEFRLEIIANDGGYIVERVR